jgi:L-threonylcarbamoyladenylate synthase
VKTEVLSYVDGPEGERSIDRAAELLRAGRLVAFPTETVYGLGALALDAGAVGRIFEAKGRPPENPLIVHVPGLAEAGEVARELPEAARRLAATFWPGPLTLVVPKRPEVPDEVTAGLPTVAIRAPSHPAARALLARVGAPIAAPSAHRYTTVSPTTARPVMKGLDGRIDAVLDGGDTPVGIESTVLDVCGVVPRLLRPGAIGRDELEREVGPVELAAMVAAVGTAQASPGLARRHYAPAARVLAFLPGAFPAQARTLPPGARPAVIASCRGPNSSDATARRASAAPSIGT